MDTEWEGTGAPSLLPGTLLSSLGEPAMTLSSGHGALWTPAGLGWGQAFCRAVAVVVPRARGTPCALSTRSAYLSQSSLDPARGQGWGSTPTLPPDTSISLGSFPHSGQVS